MNNDCDGCANPYSEEFEWRTCSYCKEQGCPDCMAECSECGRVAHATHRGRGCQLMDIDGSRMCIHCAADHIGQLATIAMVLNKEGK